MTTTTTPRQFHLVAQALVVLLAVAHQHLVEAAQRSVEGHRPLVGVQLVLEATRQDSVPSAEVHLALV